MMTIEEMRKRKRQLEYTNAQLSEMTGIPLGTLNKILSGATQHPRPEAMKALEQALQDTSYHLDQAASSMVQESEASYGGQKPAVEHKKQPGEFTVDDYYQLPDDQRVELIDGVFYDMAAPTVEHQLLLGSVHAQFLAFIRGKKGECMPLISPVDVQLDADDKTMVQPDVVVVCDRTKVKRRVVFGAPDFVLEVVSPSSIIKDYIKKAAKYEAAGVREYWIIDPIKRRVCTYDFAEGSAPGIYPLSGKVPVAIFDQELEIDLDEYQEFL